MSNRSQDGALSFSDVAEYLNDLAARRGGYYCFTVAADKRRDGRRGLSIVLERRDTIVLADCRNHPKRVWYYWPGNQYRTFAACLWGLCFQLDEKLEEAELLKQRELPI